jgi:hypothetical protein
MGLHSTSFSLCSESSRHGRREEAPRVYCSLRQRQYYVISGELLNVREVLALRYGRAGGTSLS